MNIKNTPAAIVQIYAFLNMYKDTGPQNTFIDSAINVIENDILDQEEKAAITKMYQGTKAELLKREMLNE